jgi:hypothetical protein
VVTFVIFLKMLHCTYAPNQFPEAITELIKNHNLDCLEMNGHKAGSGNSKKYFLKGQGEGMLLPCISLLCITLHHSAV